MNWLNWLGTSPKTTIGGIMLGVPPVLNGALIAANITPPKWEIFASTLILGLGGFMLGISAKDATTHSTVEQVQTATQVAAVEAAKK